MDGGHLAGALLLIRKVLSHFPSPFPCPLPQYSRFCGGCLLLLWQVVGLGLLLVVTVAGPLPSATEEAEDNEIITSAFASTLGIDLSAIEVTSFAVGPPLPPPTASPPSPAPAPPRPSPSPSPVLKAPSTPPLPPRPPTQPGVSDGAIIGIAVGASVGGLLLLLLLALLVYRWRKGRKGPAMANKPSSGRLKLRRSPTGLGGSNTTQSFKVRSAVESWQYMPPMPPREELAEGSDKTRCASPPYLPSCP